MYHSLMERQELAFLFETTWATFIAKSLTSFGKICFVNYGQLLGILRDTLPTPLSLTEWKQRATHLQLSIVSFPIENNFLKIGTLSFDFLSNKDTFSIAFYHFLFIMYTRQQLSSPSITSVLEWSRSIFSNVIHSLQILIIYIYIYILFSLKKNIIER